MDKTLDLLNSPDRWPRWPLLPLKNIRNRYRMGFIDETANDEKTIRVWDGNIFNIHNTPESPTCTEYPSAEAVLADWLID